ncbi:TetR/AcrR family transcriptional regulator [Latilactobacillus graminis]|uniref:Transcription regulator, TetR family n=2 Tax=Latilactobacillus graminis TaxID=60519 RepID=A0AA89L4K9_9LACO|nr:TetR/AcrR family transcriptional regulator [Latilactobacillus graminis]KRM23953.1 transcription regulator, TetR family [Latilactobacillus graminis DSM 20719]QFP79883.1 TetR/AcrR family transcriptional regulator [Latilactobacillus graminis]
MVRKADLRAQDPRVQRTKQRLRQALIVLLKDGTPQEISIQAITKQAAITRGTFYLHYEDKLDFIQTAVADLVADFYQQVTVVIDQPYRQVSLQMLFEYVERQQAAFKVFYKNEATLHFQKQLTEAMQKLIQDYVVQRFGQTSQADQIELSITVDYLAGASLALVFKWVEDGLVYSPCYMAKILYQLVQSAQPTFDVAQFFIKA